MKKFLALIILAIGFICPTVTIVKSIQFNQDCKGYLKQTADAMVAVEYCDVKNLRYFPDRNFIAID